MFLGLKIYVFSSKSCHFNSFYDWTWMAHGFDFFGVLEKKHIQTLMTSLNLTPQGVFNKAFPYVSH